MLVMDFGKRRETPCSDCDPADGHCTMNCGPVRLFGSRSSRARHLRRAIPARLHGKDIMDQPFDQTLKHPVIPTEAALLASLARMCDAFRPFTLRPIGGAGSQARIEQDEQIAAHAEALRLLGR